MNLDPYQRGVLAELGHVLYARVQQDAGEAAVAADVVTLEAPAPAEMAAVADVRMLAHLAKAAGMPVEALQAHAEIVRAAATLRGDGAAKRALWPRLRALRKAGQ